MLAALADSPASLPDPLLHLRDVGKHIESKAGRINLLNHIDLVIRPGDFVSIMGPSGAGKSSLLMLIYLAEKPTRGRIDVAIATMFG